MMHPIAQRIGQLAVVAFALAVSTSSIHASILSGGQPDPNYDGDSSTSADMLLWLRADMGFTAGATTSWADQSTLGSIFSQSAAAQQATLNATGLGGQATIDFDGDDWFSQFSGPTITGHQTAFFVYQDMSTASYVTPLGTSYNGDGSYHGNSNDSAIFNGTYTDPRTLNGTNLRGGSDIGTGQSTPRPDSYVIDAHVATSPLVQSITHVGADNFMPTTRSINGGIAEILLYDRALSESEVDEVGNYLASRYSLSWERPIADSAADFSGVQGQDNWFYGSYNQEADGTPGYDPNTEFQPLTSFSGTAWSSPQYLNLTANGGHPDANNPGFTSNDIDWAIRRWVSDVTGEITINGDLSRISPLGNGNGVIIEILRNGISEFTLDFDQNSGPTSYSATFDVTAGDLIDFVINPDGDNVNSDGTNFTASIFFNESLTAVPEPSGLLLVLSGLVLGLSLRQRAHGRSALR